MAVIALLRAHWPWVVAGLVAAMAVLSIIGRKQYLWTPADSGASEASTYTAPYWYRCLVALDTFVNVLAGGLPGETISARCGRFGTRPHGHWVQRFILSWLDVLQRDHGFQAISGDLARAQRIVKVESDALAAYQAAHPPPHALDVNG